MLKVERNALTTFYGNNETDKEKLKNLNTALKNLSTNPDFILLVKTYTKEEVDELSFTAQINLENRAYYFEQILNRKAFERYLEEILSFVDPDEVGENN